MPEKLTQKNRELAIGKTQLGEEVLLLVSMSGTEHLGRLFEYKLELVSEDSQIKAEDIVGPHIGQGAAIGVGANLLPGVCIGRNAIVGAGSVVTRDVPDDAVAMGVPATVRRTIDEPQAT